jgi:hypothetical protein
MNLIKIYDTYNTFFCLQGVGFEPTVSHDTSVFKTDTFNHSAIPVIGAFPSGRARTPICGTKNHCSAIKLRRVSIGLITPGLEPGTHGLKGHCSTIKLCENSSHQGGGTRTRNLLYPKQSRYHCATPLKHHGRTRLDLNQQPHG